LEFNHSKVRYYAEFDAVLLCGRNTGSSRVLLEYLQERKSSKLNNKFIEIKLDYILFLYTDSLIKKIQNLQIRPVDTDKIGNPMDVVRKIEFNKFLPDLQKNLVPETTKPIGLNDLPVNTKMNTFISKTNRFYIKFLFCSLN